MTDRYASLKQGLVGCWIPSVSGSGLLLPDLSGRGNNGVLTNMAASAWVAYQRGIALDLDGINDFVNCGYSPSFDLSAVRSITGWINARAFDGAVQINDIVTTDHITSNRGWSVLAWDFNNNDTDAAIGVYTVGTGGGDRNLYTSSELMAVNTWYHFAVCTPDALLTVADVKIFLNGREQSLTNASAGTFTTARTLTSVNTLNIGRRPDIASQDLHWNGLIDDVRLYSRVLTPHEIHLLATSEPGIGFKPAKKLSRFSQRFTYNPPKAKVFQGVRVRDHDYSSLRQGLVGAWCPSLANGGSGNTLADVSGRGNHGVLTNMSPDDWVSGQYGRALDFDGVDDEVTTNAISSLNSANQFTITYWASKNSALSDMLVGSRLSSTNGVWLQWYSDGVVYFSVRNGQQNFIQHSLTYRSDFIHFAATYRNTSSAIYIDGKSVASGTNGTVSSTGFDDFGIGALSGGFFAAGKIDDVRLYSRALTDSEIRLLASRPGIGLQPSPTRLIAREKKTGLRRKILTGQT